MSSRLQNFIPQFLLPLFNRPQVIKTYPPYYNPVGDPSSPYFDYTKYVVKPGDTLSSIAALFNLHLSTLINDNPQLHNPNLIYPGQVLNINYDF